MTLDDELRGLEAWRVRLDKRLRDLYALRDARQAEQEDDVMRHAIRDPGFQQFLLKKQFRRPD